MQERQNSNPPPTRNEQTTHVQPLIHVYDSDGRTCHSAEDGATGYESNDDRGYKPIMT